MLAAHHIPKEEEVVNQAVSKRRRITNQLQSDLQPTSSESTAREDYLQNLASPPFPLSEANLRQFNRETGVGQIEDYMSAKSNKSHMTGKSSPKQIFLVRQHLRQHRMFLEDARCRIRCPGAIKAAKEIIRDYRHSARSEKQNAYTTTGINRLEGKNEATVIAKMIEYVINKDREVPEGSGDIVRESLNTKWMSRDWSLDYLDDVRDQDLHPDALPRVDWGHEPLMMEALAVLPQLTNPRPDACWGLHMDAYAFDDQQTIIENSDITGVSRGVWNPFILMEGKGTGGSPDDAETQAIRGGAALVNARRILNQKRGQGFEGMSPGADLESYAFSFRLLPTMASLYVHWAEIISTDHPAVSSLPPLPNDPPSGEQSSMKKVSTIVLFHMHEIGSYGLRHEEQRDQLTHDLNNVFEWGIGKRNEEIKQVLRKIRENKALASSKRPAASSPTTTPQKGRQAAKRAKP